MVYLLIHQLCEIKPLGYLHLSQNKFSEAMPPCLGNLSSLRELHLGSNKLALEIPSSFWNVKDILHVNLSSNHLVGGLSSMVEKLKALIILDLSKNHISGIIPTTMGGLQNLQILSLAHNELQGSIPRSFGNLLSLENLDLSPNNLSGEISKNLEFLSALKYVNLSINKLQGEIPSGGVFKNLTPKSLMKNQILCGMPQLQVISCCSNVDFKSLVMKFMPNGSLEKWLYSHNYFLGFLQRLNIMINVASALEYLYHGMLAPIVHYDLKPSNILLDDKMIAHVSDFGISKLLDKGESKTYIETIPTIGYIAPKYGSSGVVSTKVDAYSYGIMLLEVFTRKRPTEDIFVSRLSLKSWVSESMPHAIIQVMDSNLSQGDEHHINNTLTSASSILDLALNCCINLPKAQSNMIDVVVSLNKIKASFMHRQQVMFK
ncbi:receptor kinase-like protein Xa21 [Prosopis cineraria]|uniref:receptor kinase-like protein Xa21 n=1 Tax=Prosopis cineraria TaxID=364024 RepID=UPI00240F0E58|nr:receptor kinase-like protein Xa21 [Prosopis cineraria]